jgi:hypothetical protein
MTAVASAANKNGHPREMGLALPVVVLVLAFTAIPLELRPLGTFGWEMNLTRPDVTDIVVNILGYIPIGVALASQGKWLAVAMSTLLSLAAETSQLFTVDRSASLIDLATNIIGSSIGVAIAALWNINRPRITLDRKTALFTGVLALAYGTMGTWIMPRDIEDSIDSFVAILGVARVPVSDRGRSAPGRLEARWNFDDTQGNVTPDASGNGLNGTLVNGPSFAAGADGDAIRLNGTNQYVALGNSRAFRLTGSMTISAWINASAFPRDDAAIVSSHNNFLGYQLDTTIDQGPRTIGFKLADGYGRFLARYGKTALTTGTWYHVAGVYDARLRTLDVYLNGRLDNGCLRGTVTASQHISGEPLYLGRRASPQGFWFAGLLDDVRIYSAALSPQEIEMQATATRAAALQWPKRDLQDHSADSGSAPIEESSCERSPEPDSRMAGLVVAFGLLLSIACAGLWPTAAYRLPCLLVSFGAGFLLVWSLGTVPNYYRVAIPLLTLAGGASVVASICRPRPVP